MAFDPRREDYQRLALRFARSLDGEGPVAAARAFAQFGRRFAQDRDSLPQTDADRAFHLVALATDAIDYQLPFASDERAQRLVAHARELLDEALSLDPGSVDARRILAAADDSGFETHYRQLAEHADEVRASCEEARDRAAEEAGEERLELARDLAMRPYLRWLASLAEEALICGRNHACIDACERALAADPHDTADVRFTYALALAKLEDEAGLDALAERYVQVSPGRAPDDAWMQLARMSLAYKRYDLDAARHELERLVRTYPMAAYTLVRQSELPDGVFARLDVRPYSEDELILAVSEGTVLLQEGNDETGRGVLGMWVAAEAARIDPRAAAQAQADMMQAQAAAPGGEG